MDDFRAVVKVSIQSNRSSRWKIWEGWSTQRYAIPLTNTDTDVEALIDEVEHALSPFNAQQIVRDN